MAYILSLDQGTTSSRAIVFDENSRIVSQGQQEFRQIYPAPGWVEHDPADLLASQLGSMRHALTALGAHSRDIAAVGMTNQRETVVVWERDTGRPVYNAIVWQDRRTAAECERLRQEGAEAMVRERTGLLIDPYFSASKIAWVLGNVPGARDRAQRGKLAFGTVDSWLAWHLTGGVKHVTDFTNASRTMLFNVRTGEWDEELLRLFNVPRSMLPEVVGSSGRTGEMSAQHGLGAISIAGIAGDQQAALFGQLCVNPGDAKCTYGTGCFLLQHMGGEFVQSRHRLITTLAATTSSRLEYALEGSVFVGGAVVQWLRDNLQAIRSSAAVEQLAASVPDSDGVIFVPAFVGLGAPHWDPHATGMIIGLQRGTQLGHIARAALESIAFQVADVFDAMQSESDRPVSELRVDGGAAMNDLLMQSQADLLTIPVVRPQVAETTAIGAAYLAGIAVGVWDSPRQLSSRREPDRRFLPGAPSADSEMRRTRWRNAVERSKGWTQ
jgi:glycerol kinase